MTHDTPHMTCPSNHGHVYLITRRITALVVPVKDYLGKTVAIIEALGKADTPPQNHTSKSHSRRNSTVIPTSYTSLFTAEDGFLLSSLASTAAGKLNVGC